MKINHKNIEFQLADAIDQNKELFIQMKRKGSKSYRNATVLTFITREEIVQIRDHLNELLMNDLLGID